MKKMAAAIALAFASLGASAGQDFDYSQQDYAVGYEKSGTDLTYRNMAGSDYWHVEAGQRLNFELFEADLSKVQVLYRYAENDQDKSERRYTVRYTVWENENLGLQVTPEVAYRVMEDQQDFTRYGVIVDFRKPIPGLCNTTGWVKLNPRWTAGEGQKEDFEADDGRYQAGIDYKINKFVVSGFVEYNTNTGFEKEYWMTGTKVAYTF